MSLLVLSRNSLEDLSFNLLVVDLDLLYYNSLLWLLPGLLDRLLLLQERTVNSIRVGTSKFIMAAFFHHLAKLHGNDFVSVLDSGQSMSNYDDCNISN